MSSRTAPILFHFSGRVVVPRRIRVGTYRQLPSGSPLNQVEDCTRSSTLRMVGSSEGTSSRDLSMTCTQSASRISISDVTKGITPIETSVVMHCSNGENDATS